jgi:hypothetical protein
MKSIQVCPEIEMSRKGTKKAKEAKEAKEENRALQAGGAGERVPW